MKRVFFLSCFLLSFFVTINAQTVTLYEGTVVRVRLDETLDSRVSQVGETVNMEVAEDVEVNNTVVIRRGTKVVGLITVAKPANFAGQKGKLDFSVDYIQLSNGRNIKVRYTNSNDGK